MDNQELVPVITPEEFQHNVLIVTIDKSAGKNFNALTPVKVYECTRKAWNVTLDKAQQFDFVIAKHQGLLKEIYKPEKWLEYPTKNKTKRYAFEGDIVTDSTIRNLYLDKKLDKKSYAPFIYIINQQLSAEE